MDRVPFNHIRQGSGEPLVLIHGVGHHWQGWAPVIDALAEHHDVIAVDSPGFGRSAPLPPGTPLDIPSYTDAFVAWFAELGLHRPHVAGNSMGGAIALELARRGAVRSACAVSPAGFWTPQERAFCGLSLNLLRTMPGPVRPVVRALAGTAPGRVALFAQLFGKPAQLPGAEAQAVLDDAWASPAFAGAIAGFDHYAFADANALDGVPVTVAWGDRDRLLLYGRQSARARRALPRATHVTLTGCGHVPSTDDPEQVSRTLLNAAAGA